ncbi:MAG: 4Fe-4S binding protein [Proteobacteria bacterium]|nr:4Fe-4S binding protein [Pseudomonadota bacterium]
MDARSAKDGSELLFVCSCEDSFAPDTASIGKALNAGKVVACSQLCGTEKHKLASALKVANVTIACKQEEASLGAELEALGFDRDVRFVDIRDRAGWSSESIAAGPKMAALIAAARLPPPALPFVTLGSEGVALVYGRDAGAIEAGQRLADTLDITVLLKEPRDVAPPPRRDFPLARGRIREAKGYLGAFELVVDDFALAAPSSRGNLRFDAMKNGARSRCDLIIDLTGDPPLISADSLRDGYLRADPGNPLAVEGVLAKARDLVGTFDKPKYITFDSDLCAHSRSKITGCTRCLDLCPTGAITPAGDKVSIDPAICAGCGSCASACPTGAAAYALPSTNDLMNHLRVLLRGYGAAGGEAPLLLFHDAGHGLPLIDALARFGDGLPARVLPVEINETTQLSLAEIAAAYAYGATGIVILAREKPKHDLAALHRLAALVAPILPALGYEDEAFRVLQADDPDALLTALRGMPREAFASPAASFAPAGGKRQVMMLALREWHAHAPEKPARITLPQGAPFGTINVDQAACTLCLSCVSACPSAALSANPDQPELRFQEDLCVQCGLCAPTCPEKAITLAPRLDFAAIGAPPVSLKQEEPYPCDKCGKLFGTRSTIEKIKGKLAGQHWMFSGPNADRLKLIGYCEECRIETASVQGFDPYGGPERPRVVTTDDYFRARPEDKDS